MSQLHAGVVAGVVGEQRCGSRRGSGIFELAEDFEPCIQLSAVVSGDLEFIVPKAGEDGVGAGDTAGEAAYVVDRIREFRGIVMEVERDRGEKGQGEHGGLILADGGTSNRLDPNLRGSGGSQQYRRGTSLEFNCAVGIMVNGPNASPGMEPALVKIL